MKTTTLVRPSAIAATKVRADVKQPTPGPGGARAVALLLPLGLVLVGIAWRLWFLFQIGLSVDKDEAVTGVMAQRILLGDRPVFFYGQDYMGIATAYVQAPILGLLGPGLPLRLLPMVLSALLIWLIFQLANTLYGRGVAIVSAAFIAVSPVFLTMWSLT